MAIGVIKKRVREMSLKLEEVELKQLGKHLQAIYDGLISAIDNNPNEADSVLISKADAKLFTIKIARIASNYHLDSSGYFEP